MANEIHSEIINLGAQAWNAWRLENPAERPDLRYVFLRSRALEEANLADTDLTEALLDCASLREARLDNSVLNGADLSGANLWRAMLNKTSLTQAAMSGAILSGATLDTVDMTCADLAGAKMDEAYLHCVSFMGAILTEADFTRAQCNDSLFASSDLRRSVFRGARLSASRFFTADLRGADLADVELNDTLFCNSDLRGAILTSANMARTSIIGADLGGANLTGCRVHGLAAWDLKTDSDTIQNDLVIRTDAGPDVVLDRLDCAQLVSLLLDGQQANIDVEMLKPRTVLIFGRFMPERGLVLEAVRGAVRSSGCVPMLIESGIGSPKALAAVATRLGHAASLVLLDATGAEGLPAEAVAAIEAFRPTPVQPLIQTGNEVWTGLARVLHRRWVGPLRTYQTPEQAASLSADAIAALPEQRRTRRMFKSARDAGELELPGKSAPA